MVTGQGPRTPQDMIKRLLRKERQQLLDPFFILNFMNIEPYDHVADIGCGPGFFTIPLAKYLVYGKLYALDVEQEMLDALDLRVKEAKLGNVDLLKCTGSDFLLQTGSLDGVFLAFVVHHPDNRLGFLKAAKDLLKPKGWCTILEWYRRETETGPELAQRIEPDELASLAEEAGFRFDSWRDINGQHYMAMLKKQR
jgi:ubiquinone/menaquinone biosynthesis C-methylase UbiE